jgi:hypothetical protein
MVDSGKNILAWSLKNMDREVPIHPLETFPHQELFVGMNRRSFFITIMAELKLYAHQSIGASAIKIPSLGVMPDSQLMEFIPSILSNCQIELRGDEVWGKLENWSEANFLFRMDPLVSFCFNRVNGQNNLKAIADALAAETGLSLERAFALVRGMFLTLVRAGVCLPVNNPLLG